VCACVCVQRLPTKRAATLRTLKRDYRTKWCHAVSGQRRLSAQLTCGFRSRPKRCFREVCAQGTQELSNNQVCHGYLLQLISDSRRADWSTTATSAKAVQVSRQSVTPLRAQCRAHKLAGSNGIYAFGRAGHLCECPIRSRC